MKCGKCGGSLGKSVEAHVTGVCPKCAGVLETDEWQSKLILPYTNIPDFTSTHESTGSWWVHKTEFIDFKSDFPATPPRHIDPAVADPALEAIGRAFDDAIDLAYLG